MQVMEQPSMRWFLTLPETDEEDEGDPSHFAPYQIALEGMCQLNEWHMRRALKRTAKGLDVPVPPLYVSGVRYKEDPPGKEDWRDCYQVLVRGLGDCDQLVAYRVGELRAAGIPAEPVLKWQFVPVEVMVKMQATPELARHWAEQLGWSLGHDGRLTPMRGRRAQKGLWMVHCLVRFPMTGAIEDPSKILGMGGAYTSSI